MSDVGLDRLWAVLVTRVMDVRGPLHDRPLDHHRRRGSRSPERLAARQARVGTLLAEGFSEVEIVERVGVSLRVVERDVRLLRDLFDPDVGEERRAA
jgi:DNA-binding NarL/FixJ family response regulator